MRSHLELITPAPYSLQQKVPDHLAKSPWLSFEASIGLAIQKSLVAELSRLKVKTTVARVHKSRVSLRRWFSIWTVLQEDGWESKKYRTHTIKPLRSLLKMLGHLRDLDVNLQLGQDVGVPANVLKLWRKERQTQSKRIRTYVKRLKIGRLKRNMKEHIWQRAKKLERKIACQAQAIACAFVHLEQYLAKQEAYVRQLAAHAQTPAEMHELRLGIKRWRYLLTEFFGLTNIGLVKSQQLLGEVHDYDRLTPLLKNTLHCSKALRSLRIRRRKLVSQFQMLKDQLPYGLRPAIISIKK